MHSAVLHFYSDPFKFISSSTLPTVPSLPCTFLFATSPYSSVAHHCTYHSLTYVELLHSCKPACVHTANMSSGATVPMKFCNKSNGPVASSAQTKCLLQFWRETKLSRVSIINQSLSIELLRADLPDVGAK